MIQTNLATRPFYNERLVRTILGIVGIVAVGLLLFDAAQIVRLRTRNADVRAEAEAAESEAARLRTESRAISQSLNRQQLETVHVGTERAGAMVVLAVDVVGDGSADRDPSGTRHHRQEPAPRNDQREDLGQGHSGLAAEEAGGFVEADQAVQPRDVEQHAAVVQATVAVAPPVCMGEHRLANRVERRRSGSPHQRNDAGMAGSRVASP